VTEQEAAERLCALLNEMDAAGHELIVDETTRSLRAVLVIGSVTVVQPFFDDEPWEIQ